MCSSDLSATGGGAIELRLGSATGTLVGRCAVAGTGGWGAWATVTCPVSGAAGTKDLFLRFTGGSGNLFNFDWWQFGNGSGSGGGGTAPQPTTTAGGGGGGGATTTTRAPAPTTTANIPEPNCQALYAQCGGSGWTGATCCSQGTCKVSNEWYSQCV